MNKNEEYFFAYKGRDIIIKIGKKIILKKWLYFMQKQILIIFLH